jgi:hypothetical protein
MLLIHGGLPGRHASRARVTLHYNLICARVDRTQFRIAGRKEIRNEHRVLRSAERERPVETGIQCAAPSVRGVPIFKGCVLKLSERHI